MSAGRGSFDLRGGWLRVIWPQGIIHRMGFMGLLNGIFYPWGYLLQAVAIVHFIRRRPETYWIWVILFLGPIGALVYIFAEALPDLGLLRGSMKMFPRRKRIRQLEGLVRDNPSAGNYEELGRSEEHTSELQTL